MAANHAFWEFIAESIDAQAGFIGIGNDVLVADATCAPVIDLDPDTLTYLFSGGRYLGQSDPRRIDQRGENLDRYPTQIDVIDSMKERRLVG